MSGVLCGIARVGRGKTFPMLDTVQYCGFGASDFCSWALCAGVRIEEQAHGDHVRERKTTFAFLLVLLPFRL